MNLGVSFCLVHVQHLGKEVGDSCTLDFILF